MNLFSTLKQDLLEPEAIDALKLTWRSLSFWVLAGALTGWIGCQFLSAPTPPLTEALAIWLFSVLLAAIAVADFKTFIIPDMLIWPLLIIGVLVDPVPLLSGLTAAGFLLFMFWMTKLAAERASGQEAMGYGDLKLVFVLGVWIGVTGIAPLLLVASLTALLTVLLVRLWGYKNKHIPFAPFLALGGWVAFVYGDIINDWLITTKYILLGMI